MTRGPFITKRLFGSRDSVGVYIPKAFASALELTREVEVKVYLVGKVVCIQRSNADSFVPGVVGIAARPPEET